MKRHNILILLVFLLATLSLTNCRSGNKSDEIAQKRVPESLDTLMRFMHEDAKILKALVEAGNQPDSSILAMHRAMYSATPTNPKVTGEVFEGYAGAYLGSLEALMKPGGLTPARFNLLVDNCVACHSTYCTGPIPVIKKLHIPEEEDGHKAEN